MALGQDVRLVSLEFSSMTCPGQQEIAAATATDYFGFLHFWALRLKRSSKNIMCAFKLNSSPEWLSSFWELTASSGGVGAKAERVRPCPGQSYSLQRQLHQNQLERLEEMWYNGEIFMVESLCV